MNTLRFGAAALLAAAVLVGCATSTQVANQIVKTNEAQESAENQLLLLNIIRASQRSPMHFTQVTAVHLPVGFGNPNFSLSLPFGGDPKGNVLGGSLAIPQSMDATFQNTQDFMRGITTPLPPSLMMYYLDQGWPSEMILMLFVREIKVYSAKDEPPHVLTNYPESAEAFNDYAAMVTELANCSFELKPDEPKPFGPPIPEAALASVKPLVEARGASMTLEAAPTKLPSSAAAALDALGPAKASGASRVARAPAKAAEAASAPKFYQLMVPSKGSHIELAKRESPGNKLAAGNGTSPPDNFKCNLDGVVLATKGDVRPAHGAKRDSDYPSYELVLRSPEAMLYYLGEIARTQLAGSSAAAKFPQMKYQALDAQTKQVASARLFGVQRGLEASSPASAAVSVKYGDETYSVMKTSKDDQSTHVLSLMSQIIAMQNKGSDLPGTATVHVVP